MVGRIPRRQPGREDPRDARQDEPEPGLDHALRNAAAPVDRLVGADAAPAHAGPGGVRLCPHAFPVLRAGGPGPGLRHPPRGRRQAAVHHGGLYRVPVADPACAHLDPFIDAPARAPLGTAAQAGVCDGAAWLRALLLAGQGRRPRAAILLCRARGTARLAAVQAPAAPRTSSRGRPTAKRVRSARSAPPPGWPRAPRHRRSGSGR
jgi:hypothetical protein